MTAPDPRDTGAVLDHVRREGSVMWPLAALPDDFLGWRRRIRAAAREATLRISVRRVGELAFIEHVDHVVTDDQNSAMSKIIGAHLDGRTISWDDAVHESARDRMNLVPGQHQPTHDDDERRG